MMIQPSPDLLMPRAGDRLWHQTAGVAGFGIRHWWRNHNWSWWRGWCKCNGHGWTDRASYVADAGTQAIVLFPQQGMKLAFLNHLDDRPNRTRAEHKQIKIPAPGCSMCASCFWWDQYRNICFKITVSFHFQVCVVHSYKQGGKLWSTGIWKLQSLVLITTVTFNEINKRDQFAG